MDKNPEATVEQARARIVELTETRALSGFCRSHGFPHSTIYRFGLGELVELRYTRMCALLKALGRPPAPRRPSGKLAYPTPPTA